MTVHMFVLYRAPDDRDAFEARYVEGHLPLVKAYPNIADATFARVSRRLLGEFPYEYVFTGTWTDRDAWKADLGSDQAKRATEDAQSFAPPFDVVITETIA